MKKTRHHYVPRFYLKYFASDRHLVAPKQIDLFNIDKQQIIFNASLRTQCYKHKFYGKSDDTENLLANLETSFAKITKNILMTKSLPNINSDEYVMLLLFVVLQMNRTKRMAEDFNAYIQKFNQLILLRNKVQLNLDDKKIKEIKMGIKDPVLLLLPHTLKMAMSIDDLKVILFVSDCEAKFITSDAPVFMYNKYCEGIKGATTGLIAEGAQIFFPISPEICLLLFDNKVYKVGNKSSPIIKITSSEDIFQINSIQYIGADNNLYFNNYNRNYFQNIHSKYFRKRASYKPKVLEFEGEKNKNSSIIVNYHNVPNLELNLSFISIKRSARRIKLSERNTRYRRPMPLMPGEEPRSYGNLPKDKYGNVLKKINEL